jgi:hypothetical protein
MCMYRIDPARTMGTIWCGDEWALGKRGRARLLPVCVGVGVGARARRIALCQCQIKRGTKPQKASGRRRRTSITVLVPQRSQLYRDDTGTVRRPAAPLLDRCVSRRAALSRARAAAAFVSSVFACTSPKALSQTPVLPAIPRTVTHQQRSTQTPDQATLLQPPHFTCICAGIKCPDVTSTRFLKPGLSCCSYIHSSQCLIIRTFHKGIELVST